MIGEDTYGTVWLTPPVAVEFGAKVLAFDPAFDLVLIETSTGAQETHQLGILSEEHRQLVLRAAAR